MNSSFGFELKDQGDQPGIVRGRVWLTPTGLAIKLDGYGERATEPGYGQPIHVELYQGCVRVLIWNDITEEDPTVISLEGARESNRLPSDLTSEEIETERQQVQRNRHA